MQQVNWGIIGCGNVTEKKSGPAFNAVANSRLVAVMRRNQNKARDYARRHRVPKWYGDADELINDPDVDAVYIATPPDSHAEYTLRVADAGKPVYVEKPMARTSAECRAMIEACERAKVPLFVAYYRRSLARFTKIKQLINSGTIGDIRFLHIEMIHGIREADRNQAAPPWRVLPEVGGGYFYDLASHQFDFFQYVFGPIEEASGMVENRAGLYAAEDLVFAQFKFSNGVPGCGAWCFSAAASGQIDQVKVIGSDGELTFSFFGHQSAVLVSTQEGEQKYLIPVPETIQRPHIEHIVDELHGTGKCPSHGRSAARTNWVLEQITGN